jgi:hypothetical protein
MFIRQETSETGIRFRAHCDCRRDVAQRAVDLHVNIVMAGFLPPQPTSAPASEAHAGTITICTSAGMITIDAEEAPQSPQSHTGHAALCAFCLPIMHASVLATASNGHFSDASFWSQVILAFDAEFVPSAILLSGAASPRAPPFV